MKPAPFVPWRLAAMVGCAVLFAALLAAVDGGLAQPIDLAVNASLAPLRTPALLATFLWITMVGTEACRLALILAATALLWSEGRARLLLPLWATALGSEATTWVAKVLIARPRPAFLPDVATALSPSFPSAHSAGTLALIGSLAVIVARGRIGREHRTAIIVAATALVALIGFSRLLLNVHFPTDVLSGFLVGGFWLLLGSALGRDAPQIPQP